MSAGGVFGNDNVLRVNITDSLRTRRALSLVSWQVHTLCDEFLFETIYITEHKHIHPLVKLLHRCADSGLSRGWWCRQLFLDIGAPHNHWSSGRRDLWGLLPACPRIVDLHCDLRLKNLRHRRRWHNTRYGLSNHMTMTIANTVGPNLRLLEFGERVSLNLDTAMFLLSHLPHLELCRLLCLKAPWPVEEDSGSVDSEDERLSSDHWEGKSNGSGVEPDTALEGVATLSDRVRLPSLRLLHLNTFVPVVSKWELPKLEEVLLALTRNYGENLCLAVILKGLTPHASHITHLTYEDGPCIDVWVVAAHLPALKYFAFGNSQFDLDSSLPRPQENLHTIVINRRPAFEREMSKLLLNIAHHVKTNMLPALQQIRLVGMDYGEQYIQEHIESFQSYGIHLSA
ncbi:hypothetical protein CALCODRAFT_23166 [Calocera cornea HHB12733]|uniref:F-box domain-containing protein n=1 Tax=Calocera cornea HHB12733 TaxID=1353952 RepID=A0A165E5N6_9BASI|nr:hypothetical protein CALCODRAFT_23166 [Calocera cornea HHB12733]